MKKFDYLLELNSFLLSSEFFSLLSDQNTYPPNTILSMLSHKVSHNERYKINFRARQKPLVFQQILPIITPIIILWRQSSIRLYQAQAGCNLPRFPLICAVVSRIQRESPRNSHPNLWNSEYDTTLVIINIAWQKAF